MLGTMSRITSAAPCRRCGGRVQPGPGRDQVTCSDCGKTSFTERALAPQPLVKHPTSALFIALGVSVIVTLAGALAAFSRASRRPAPRPPVTPSETYVETEPTIEPTSTSTDAGSP